MVMESEVISQDPQALLVTMLRGSPVLRNMSDAQIAAFASRASLESYKQGQVILKQGTPSTGFYFIIDGQVEILDETTAPPTVLNFMEGGKFLGELGIRYNKPREATAKVVVDVLTARFEKADWDWLLRTAPYLHEEFKTIEAEYRKHKTIEFEGQQPDEVGILKIKRHILVYFARLFFPLLLLTSGLVLVSLVAGIGNRIVTDIIRMLGEIAAVAGVLWAIYEYFEWANDDFIVSSKRVIHIERYLMSGAHREEAPLTQVLGVEVSTPDFFTRTFGYTYVIIKTAGVGNIVFDGIYDGDAVKEIITTEVDKANKRVRAADIAAIRKALSEQMGTHQVKAVPQKSEAPPPPHTRQRINLLKIIDYYIPRVRQETPTGITWRKHYWVWAKQIWLPTLIWIPVTYLLVAATIGFQPFPQASITAAIFLALLWVGIWGWYTYKHDEWHKDSYHVTDTKIVHQNSPVFQLRGEDINETTFDNVQNINYNIPNFLSRILQIGDVIIKTASVGDPFIFNDVYFPKDVQQDIFKYWVKFKEKQRAKAQAREEKRFITWLGEYHNISKQKQP